MSVSTCGGLIQGVLYSGGGAYSRRFSVCSWLVEQGRFQFNGLTSQIRIIFSVSIEKFGLISQISSENGNHSNVI